MDPLLELPVKQEVFVPTVLLRYLKPLEDLGLVVEQVGDLHHAPPHVKLVLQHPTDHLELLALLDELLVRAFLLEVLVTAEQL